MTVQIRSIADAGNLEKERIVFQVEADTDVGQYALFRSAYEDGSVTTSLSHAFWFPDKEVGSGDLVVVYSKPGRDNERTNKDGTKSHFFYWGVDEILWDSSKYSVVLVHIDRWSSKNPSDD